MTACMSAALQIEGKVGGKMEDARLVQGIVIDKDFSHPQVRATFPSVAWQHTRCARLVCVLMLCIVMLCTSSS